MAKNAAESDDNGSIFRNSFNFAVATTPSKEQVFGGFF